MTTYSNRKEVAATHQNFVSNSLIWKRSLGLRNFAIASVLHL
ncbi:hypothetical protein [Trichocoleus sp. FACHB-262]|nr:hypothetical protein [Trichocoleus sp. FACHB-262]